VNEKQENVACAPSSSSSSTNSQQSSSTNRPAESAAAASSDPQDSGGGTSTNSIGGKRRAKRQAHDFDVVFDGVGHEVVVEKRILVNISIATDDGIGTTYQQVYELKVAVPLPREKMSEDFYAYRGADEEADSRYVVIEGSGDGNGDGDEAFTTTENTESSSAAAATTSQEIDEQTITNGDGEASIQATTASMHDDDAKN